MGPAELTIVLRIIGAVQVLLALRGSDAFADVRGSIDTLVGQLNAKLPAKADGSPWNEDDIKELAQMVRDTNARILDRTLDPGA